jgi:putative transcriptional regulator
MSNAVEMSFKPLEIDRQNLTIMGVSFSSASDFESTVNAIGAVMYEGFEPTPKKSD